MSWTGIALFIQLFFGIIIGLYFWNLLKNQRTQKVTIDKESKKEMEQLRKMRAISLSEPLSEKVRPKSFKDIVGQEDGIKALKAALCGPNPQHVIVYGPPGVGKTAAARLVLEEAKKHKQSPFKEQAVFVELDATTARFDERGIADPLIGSVHDPIYQGAGAMGQAGIPQPKQGAVTHAHGGVLFIDEIGELHPIQMNKMLKVLEDRKVFLDSAYYSEENTQIPNHIHDIFQNGLPADFRLIGATTRMPNEIPPAIRSRCLEVFFRELEKDELKTVAKTAADKIEKNISEEGLDLLTSYTRNGREAVNMIQIAAGMAVTENRKDITIEDIEWVIHSSQLTPKHEQKIGVEPQVGIVNGLAVYGPNSGSLLEIEVSVTAAQDKGSINITGIAEEESIGSQSKSIRRKSMAKGSVENVLTVLRTMGMKPSDYDIHINFPGGIPIDGPSAGIAMAAGIFSAIHKIPIDNTVAMTGEISLNGLVKPIGGVIPKIKAAKQSGAKKVIIPYENQQAILKQIDGIEIIAVKTFQEVLDEILVNPPTEQKPFHIEINKESV
ncbi:MULTISPECIES: ATP-dependent protease LonB [Bacillaceae]|jgi:ATP-dependent protease LonB|uniref:Lon protease 2 n=7 Tax=Bacilli TaxID=91061 RepID=LON2_BACSU|nr:MULTISPECIES: ATP-dependent protease LonB [Bacillales]NP_390699.1 spore-specific ATP-dependent protease LonB [Bacillus subtilis subsp. subtilis str. 168]P42425.2 RecName: Full=Lon protease 2; AltName: Full=ATP-dependent protease La 2 [Bacillus subtilis subsp. subtilis str. 168]WJD91234.1 ATP-dependent protease LonB [Bacillus spizizenii]BAM53257.1 LonB ATP-dependent protease [Bacillus subtilis BEST7613]AAA84744.1 Lon-like protease [Bacillus subtilis subsp. subtilis str. 168]AFQ58667.1 LonB 